MIMESDFVRLVTSALFVSLATGCASVAPLNDAELTGLALASSEDLARYSRAKEQHARENFGYSSFSDGRGNIVASFDPDEYDEYLAYLREHPERAPNSDLRTLYQNAMSSFPKVRLTFQSRRALFDPGHASIPSVILYLCDEQSGDQRLIDFGMQKVLWRDRLASRDLVQEIENVRQAEAQLQEYEVFFSYLYWNQEEHLQQNVPATLLPIPGDLCLALYRWNKPLSSSEGRPLRIDKNVVNDALGPLPRPF